MTILDFDAGRPSEGHERVDYRRLNAHLLRTARHIIHGGGYDELTMSGVAEAAGCARKTLYNHFENRIDLILALCIQSSRRRAEMVGRAAMYKASTRERMAGIGCVMHELLPHHMRHEVLLFSIDTSRAPEARRMELRLEEERFQSIVAGVVRAAVASGELELPESLPPDNLAMTIHQLYIGHYSVAQRGFSLGSHSLEESRMATVRTMRTLYDDLGWLPLWGEIDYYASHRRMWKEVFPELLEKFDVQLE